MALSVRLAGYNIDADLLREIRDHLKALEEENSAAGGPEMSAADWRALWESVVERSTSNLNSDALTPETISAAYARISRDPRPVSELRRAARHSLARSRKSNENIIFGLGHASIAEHACFNLDVLGLSRLAAEDLQSHRLLSFTEKSQRYISVTTDFVVPPELAGTAWATEFERTVPTLFARYESAAQALLRHRMEAMEKDAAPEARQEAENLAQEDARYLLPLACTTQMGMTVNARNIEHITRDFSDHPLQEVRALGQAVREAVGDLAPSLVKYTTRGPYPRRNRRRLESLSDTGTPECEPQFYDGPSCRLLHATPDGEQVVLRALAFSSGQTAWPPERCSAIWDELFRDMTEHEGAIREFELASLTFEAEMSASCFAQLKRHRMLTLVPRGYQVADGAVVPPSIDAAGLGEEFRDTMRSCWKLAHDLSREHPFLAPYLLTNGQRKQVLIHLNAREMYHFTRLRCDARAQWEIRSLADQMLTLARGQWPNLLALAGGKDQFADLYRARYGPS
jgi:flavin-dependent thymidylate synthase